MRKKFTMLFAALLACVGVMKAGVTDLPELSTEDNIKWYTIKNVKSSVYAAYTGDGAQMTLNSTVVDASYLFYFTAGEATAEGATVVKIHNYVTNKLCAGHSSWTDTGIDWYLNAQENGVSISNSTDYTNNNSSWNNFQGAGKKIAYYNAADGGSAWVIEPYKGDIVLNNLKMSTDAEKYFYFIQNRRQNGKFANYVASGTALSQTTSAGAGSYWYFVDASEKLPEGTKAPDGYKACYIYNAATAEPLNSPDNGSVASVDNAPIFYVRKLSHGNYWDFVIYNCKGTDGWNDFAGVKVCTHSINDAGSIWSIVDAGKTETELIAAAKAAVESAASLMPIAKEAYYYSYPDAAIAAAEVAIASFSEESLATAMSSQVALEAALKEKRTTAPAVGDLIILKNKSNGNFLTDDGESAKVNTQEKEENAGWEVVVGENGVKLKNYKTGRYLGTIKQSEATSTIAEDAEGIAEFEWNNQKDVYAVFKPVGGGYYQYGHFSGGDLVGWEPGADATQWIATKVCSLTISYRYNGKTLDTTSEYAKVGTYTVSSPYAFTKVGACKKGEETLEVVDGVCSLELTEATTLTVELEDALPFTTTVLNADGSFPENTAWYVVKQHSSVGYAQAWKYDETNGVTTEATTSYTDNHMWCFVGGAFDLKIYNKVAGNTVSLTNSDPASMKADNKAVWKMAQSNAEASFAGKNPFCLQNGDAASYLNRQDNKLKYWSSRDQGSTIIAIPLVNVTYSLNDYKSEATTTEKLNGEAVIVTNPYNLTAIQSVAVNGKAIEAVDGVWKFSVAGSVDVVVTLVNDMPFETTTISDGKFAADTKWYVLKQKNANSNWMYDEAAETENVVVKGEAYNIYNPAHLWCFTGNAIQGVRVYNKAAGIAYSLDNDSPAKLVEAENAAVWTVESSEAAFGADDLRFALKAGDNYANLQNGKLGQYWLKDAGSTSCAVPVSVVAEEIATAWKKWFEFEGIVGGLATTDGLQDLIDAYLANPSQNTEDAVNSFIATQKIELNEGYYFIKGTGVGNDAAKYVTYNSNNKFQAVNEKLGAKHVWHFAAVDDGYSMKSCNLDKYAKLDDASKISSGPSEFAAEAVKFTFTNSGDGKFIIKDADSHVMRSEGDGRINFWASETNESWYLVPVTELEITINEFASICMPFNVEVEGATAYAVTATAATSATLKNISQVIPAGQGAILEAEGENTTATLKLTNEKADWTGNMLQGTTKNTYVEGAAYVLANGNNGVGLYKAALNKDAEGNTVTENGTHFLNNANKAYLPAPAGAAAPMFSFNRGEGTSSIEDVELINDNVVIYDITGRRVEKMEKGIYIVNGKKVLVK